MVHLPYLLPLPVDVDVTDAVFAVLVTQSVADDTSLDAGFVGDAGPAVPRAV